MHTSCANEQLSLHWLFSTCALTFQAGRSSTSVLHAEATGRVKKLFTLWSAYRKKNNSPKKVVNFPKASQTLCVFAEHLSLVTQAGGNTHTKVAKQVWVSGTFNQAEKSPARIWNEEWGHQGFITSAPSKASREGVADDTQTHKQTTEPKHLKKCVWRAGYWGEYLNETMKGGWC